MVIFSGPTWKTNAHLLNNVMCGCGLLLLVSNSHGRCIRNATLHKPPFTPSTWWEGVIACKCISFIHHTNVGIICKSLEVSFFGLIWYGISFEEPDFYSKLFETSQSQPYRGSNSHVGWIRGTLACDSSMSPLYHVNSTQNSFFDEKIHTTKSTWPFGVKRLGPISTFWPITSEDFKPLTRRNIPASRCKATRMIRIGDT
jgi:hypothetical protein